ncbi:Protein sum2 [Colletotrichum tanaceti]|uniref:Protein sum2 n=1 Tax=Colletotrichum tanaceti TaxID=1306861 RepID=A0A4U6XM21_9PEZI|nr:Protein sum2 [Colletotrichum tanaceti]TKW56684.1 Protein sum2 [Colletotrichum tanaceti]
MSEFLGSRISLISKSDIRYVGVLHEINSDESTVSLENVRSFGTEGRRNRPEEEIAPSDQVYDYIIFRGSDVKDLRIEDHPGIKENKPPAMPEDPAIVNARPRPGQGPNNQPPPAPGFGQPPFQNNFYPPPGPWGPAPGRGGPGGPGGPPGAGMGGMPYPPPPGWFPPGPPGQGFPGPDQWNNYNNYPPGPRGPPVPSGPLGLGGAPGQASENRGTPGPQDVKPPPVGPAGDKQKPTTPAAQGTQSESKPAPPPGFQQAPAPTPPVESKPSAAEVKATAASLNTTGPSKPVELPVPTGPKIAARVQPAVPLAGSMPKAFPVPINDSNVTQAVSKSAAGPTAASVRDATEAAKAAVALAMANMNAGNATVPTAPQGNGNAMDNLTKKVNEMRVNAARTTQPGGGRGRGRGGRQGQTKVDVPDADFDFAQANAKFNKDDLVKEAIAGSPLGETPNNGPVVEAPVPEVMGATPPVAYNKTRSFFDNISSEAKDRADNNGQKPGGREWRGEEQRKNMETFGQGSVDGGYRGYRGRGRGRGRGGYGGRGGRGGGFRGRGGQGAAASPAAN